MKQIALYFVFIRLLLANGSPLPGQTESPCLDHYRSAIEELSTVGNISEAVGYVPRCHLNGITWQLAQCSALNGGSCFCVDPETGVAQEDTRTSDLSWESLVCEETTNQGTTCEDALVTYLTFLGGNLNVADAPFGYMPSCAEDGKFEAMQRNAFYFFCVDATTGQEIPESESVPGMGRPLTENVCQAYSHLWQSYRGWLEETGLEVLEQTKNTLATAETCPEGFEFQTCGCERICNPGKEMSKAETCDHCKPVCVCPSGSYLHNGTCVTGTECSNMEEEQFTFKVKETLWNTYKMVNGNDLLKEFWELSEESVISNETAVSANSSVINETLDLLESYVFDNNTDENGEGESDLYQTEEFSWEEYDSGADGENEGNDSQTIVTETLENNSSNEETRTVSPEFISGLYDRILEKLPTVLANRLRLFRNQHREMFERLLYRRTTQQPEVESTTASNSTS